LRFQPPAENRSRAARQDTQEPQKLWEVSDRGIVPPTETLTGQTSWSKALVRHGADPRTALAGVLGVSAGEIRLRNCGE